MTTTQVSPQLSDTEIKENKDFVVEKLKELNDVLVALNDICGYVEDNENWTTDVKKHNDMVMYTLRGIVTEIGEITAALDSKLMSPGLVWFSMSYCPIWTLSTKLNDMGASPSMYQLLDTLERRMKFIVKIKKALKEFVEEIPRLNGDLKRQTGDDSVYPMIPLLRTFAKN